MRTKCAPPSPVRRLQKRDKQKKKTETWRTEEGSAVEKTETWGTEEREGC